MSDNRSHTPLFLSQVHAGFPSPADDHEDKRLDLNNYLIKNKAATFFVRASGDSMMNAGIFPGDLLIVDRSIEAKSGDVVVSCLDGEFAVKRIIFQKTGACLRSDNPSYGSVKVSGENEFYIWGVVTFVIHGLSARFF